MTNNVVVRHLVVDILLDLCQAFSRGLRSAQILGFILSGALLKTLTLTLTLTLNLTLTLTLTLILTLTLTQPLNSTAGR